MRPRPSARPHHSKPKRTRWLPRVLTCAALAVAACTAFPMPARAQSVADRKAAAEAQDRAREALQARKWSEAVPHAVRAATLNPYRLNRLMAAVALSYTDAWREAAIWLQPVEVDGNVDDPDVKQMLSLLTKRSDALQAATQDCAARLTHEQFAALAQFVPASTEVKARVTKRVCLRARLPALGSGVRVVQGKRTLAADAEGLYRVAAGRIEVVLGNRTPVPLEVRGEEDQVVAVRLPDDPALRGSIMVRGLPGDSELWVDGAQAQPDAAHRLTLAPATHELVARAPGRVEFRQSVPVGIADDRTVEVRLAKEIPWIAKWLVGGGALLAAGGGGGFWLWGVKPMQDDLGAAATDPLTGREASTGYQDRAATVDSANQAQWATGAVIGVGAAAALAGLYLWATFDDTPPEWAVAGVGARASDSKRLDTAPGGTE